MFGSTYDQRADVWSLGCVLGELVTQKVLFPNYPIGTMVARMGALFGPFHAENVLSGRCSFKILTAGLCVFDEDSLLIANNGLFEQWLFGDYLQLTEEQLMLSDFIRQMLRLDYQERPTTAMLMGHPFLE